jgi:hypothetical protein
MATVATPPPMAELLDGSDLLAGAVDDLQWMPSARATHARTALGPRQRRQIELARVQ